MDLQAGPPVSRDVSNKGQSGRLHSPGLSVTAGMKVLRLFMGPLRGPSCDLWETIEPGTPGGLGLRVKKFNDGASCLDDQIKASKREMMPLGLFEGWRPVAPSHGS